MVSEISSAQNPLIKHLIRLRDQRRYRYRERALVLEGAKIVRELLGKVEMRRLVHIAEADVAAWCPENVERIRVPGTLFTKLTSLEAPDGVLAEIAMPEWSPLRSCSRLLVCDAIQDPGNLGALFRSAEAFGWEHVFLLEGCCDPYNPKSLSAARGSTFRLHLSQGDWRELGPWIETEGMTAYVADLDGQSPEAIAEDRNCCLVLSNEAKGPSEETLSHCQKVTLPMQGAVESLNVGVAGGILMYLLRKRL